MKQKNQNQNKVKARYPLDLLKAKVLKIGKIMDDVQELYEKEVDRLAVKWWEARWVIWEMEAEIKEALKINQGGQNGKNNS